jgi:hypothetical protein
VLGEHTQRHDQGWFAPNLLMPGRSTIASPMKIGCPVP